jgi:hypothetical protein
MHRRLLTGDAQPSDRAQAVASGLHPASTHLRADCGHCCGLCCVAPSFEQEQGFGFSKPAHSPCTHLESDFRCRIHGELTARGFPACSTFDCYGAGQRVTRLFRGESWRDQAELAARMFQAYSRYRGLHELLAMLELALAHAVPEARTRLQERCRWLDALCESGEALEAGLTAQALRGEVLAEIRAALNPAPASTACADEGS